MNTMISLTGPTPEEEERHGWRHMEMSAKYVFDETGPVPASLNFKFRSCPENITAILINPTAKEILHLIHCLEVAHDSLIMDEIDKLKAAGFWYEMEKDRKEGEGTEPWKRAGADQEERGPATLKYPSDPEDRPA